MINFLNFTSDASFSVVQREENINRTRKALVNVINYFISDKSTKSRIKFCTRFLIPCFKKNSFTKLTAHSNYTNISYD